jgi:hypothetical protein
MEHVWKLQISPYNHVNLNSHSRRSRKIRNFREFIRFFQIGLNPQ